MYANFEQFFVSNLFLVLTYFRLTEEKLFAPFILVALTVDAMKGLVKGSFNARVIKTQGQIHQKASPITRQTTN